MMMNSSTTYLFMLFIILGWNVKQCRAAGIGRTINHEILPFVVTSRSGVPLQCTPKPDRCVHNIGCRLLGLEGSCCPTPDGQYLGCCNVSDESCAETPACDALGLTGACCPTTDNEYLDCCKEVQSTTVL